MRKMISKSKLLELRLRENLTYRQLAEEVNKKCGSVMVSAASLNRWESQPESHVCITKLSALAKYFDVPLNDLLLESSVETSINIEPKQIPIDSIKLEIIEKIVSASEMELLVIADFINKL